MKPFRTFTIEHPARELTQFLKEKGLAAQFKVKGAVVDTTLTGNPLSNEYQVLLPESEHAKAEEVLAAGIEEALHALPDDHYLKSFSDDELKDMLRAPDEWSKQDVALANMILQKRGVEISASDLEEMQEERLAELSAGEDGQPALVYAGYFFALLGGLLGFVIGYHLWKARKTLPNGQEVPTYSTEFQRKGKGILQFAFVMVVVWAVVLFWLADR